MLAAAARAAMTAASRMQECGSTGAAALAGAPGPELPARSSASAPLGRLLLEAVTSVEEADAARAVIAQVLVERGLASSAVWLVRDSDGRLVTGCTHPAGAAQSLPPEAFTTVAEQACRQGEVCASYHPSPLVAAPVFCRGAPPEALVLRVRPPQTETAQHAAALAATHASFADLWCQVHDAAATVRATAAVLEIVERVEQADNVATAAGELADQLQRYCGCARAAVGVCRRGRCRIESLSGTEEFDRQAELTRVLEAAMDETLLRRATTVFPHADPAHRLATRAHQRLAAVAEVPCVVSVPLQDAQGETVGSCVVLGETAQVATPGRLRFLEALAPHAAQSLNLVRAASGARRRRRLIQLAQRRSSVWGLLAAVLLAATLCAPVPFGVKCGCELEPITRRFVAAPYDAKLAQALVSPGDVVAPHDILARVDGREMRWELEGILVDYDHARKKYDSALAKQNVSDAQLAQLEMERLELRRALLDHRLDHMEIKSPIAGIVLSGDLQRTEGAPLSIGETLFEIAPLDTMVVKLAIPESDIVHVGRGYSVSVTLDAYPGRRWSGALEKIHPRAELIDNRSVFVGEVTLENASGLLRPGMKGRAKVAAGDSPLAWNLFHKPWEALLKAYYGW